MRMYDIICKKRDGFAFSREEIDFFIEGVAGGRIPDYQISALLMAIYLKGMTLEEATELTLAIARSGDQVDLSAVEGIKADKHSTGGVGDKTTLIVAPVVAACGVKVAKMSGRGLGHTGGTIDKLESIPGVKTEFSVRDLIRIVRQTGLAVVGQSGDLAPADKKLYALRDVTATIDSPALIAASVMGKKLAAGADVIVLDVKTGSGAFMKTDAEAEALASYMVEIGKRAGKKTAALITDMSVPLGNAIGNALEVKEALEVLHGRGPADLTELCYALSAAILEAACEKPHEACVKMVAEAVSSGRAYAAFRDMVAAQGGDVSYLDNPDRFPAAKYEFTVCADRSGYIGEMDAEGYGRASVLLGAGRNTKEDKIDTAAGIRVLKKTGDPVRTGEAVAVLYASDRALFSEAAGIISDSFGYSEKKPPERMLIRRKIS